MDRASGNSTWQLGGAILHLTFLTCLLGTLSSSFYHRVVGHPFAGATGMSDNLQYQDVADAQTLKEDSTCAISIQIIKI